MLLRSCFVLFCWVFSCVKLGAIDKETIHIKNIFSRETMGPNGAVFMKIQNTSDKDIALKGATSEIASRVELHTHLEEDGIMKMRPVEKMVIPADSFLQLKPGALHLMLMGLKSPPLKEGDQFTMRLIFDNGLTLKVNVPVKTAGYQHCGCSK